MLGWNHSVRNVPDSNSTMNDHSAISPSMNDQCSGNTLRSGISLLLAPRPIRSSIHSTGPETFLPKSVFSMGLYALLSSIALVQLLLVAREFRVARRDDLLEVSEGDEVPVGVDAKRELGERPVRRAEDDLAAVGEVERRLVAGAQ